MNRTQQGIAVVSGIVVVSTVILIAAIGWGPKDECFPIAIPRIIGCTLAQYENLTGGLIAAGGALFAGWLAWSAVQEQVEIEKKKVKAAEIAEQSRIADEISRDLSDLKAAQWAGKKLLQELREDLRDPSPYATRLVQMCSAQRFSTTSRTWTPRIVGDDLLNLVNRIRLLAERIHEDLRVNDPAHHPVLLKSAEHAASDLIAEFNSHLDLLAPVIEGRQEALTEANARLTEMKIS